MAKVREIEAEIVAKEIEIDDPGELTRKDVIGI